VPGTTAKKTYSVRSSTLRSWAEQGHVRCDTTKNKGGHRYYFMRDIHEMFRRNDVDEPERVNYCYARGSSAHQKQDLERQVQELQEAYPQYHVLSDVGSGLDWKRERFLHLVDGVLTGTVGEVVVSYPDRLCWFGFDLLWHIFAQCGTKLVGLGQQDHTSDQPDISSSQEEEMGQDDSHIGNETDDLRDDLLSIATVFVARNQAQRAAANRK